MIKYVHSVIHKHMVFVCLRGVKLRHDPPPNVLRACDVLGVFQDHLLKYYELIGIP